MTIWMWLFIMTVIVQRFVELLIAKNNEKWMKSKGGIEKGRNHYKCFILLHICFFIAIIMETSVKDNNLNDVNYLLLFIFIAAQAGRFWAIQSLGRFWNTKVIVVPGVVHIKKGPYKYVKHPNYIIVAIELLIIPLFVGAIITALVFPLLHLFLLMIRVPLEEKALTKTI